MNKRATLPILAMSPVSIIFATHAFEMFTFFYLFNVFRKQTTFKAAYEAYTFHKVEIAPKYAISPFPTICSTHASTFPVL